MDINRFRREVELVDFTARHLWRFLRPFFRRSISPRCSQCIAALPDSKSQVCESCMRPPVRFNAGSQIASASARVRLEAEISSAIGTGKQYDALVLFSGGKDSTYLIKRLREDFPGLHFATVLVDNGLMSPVALENARRVVDRLELPHIVYRPDLAFVRKVFRHALLNLQNQTGYSLVDILDGCITNDSGRILAARLGAPLVICGIAPIQMRNIFGHTDIILPWETNWAPIRDTQLDFHGILEAQERKFWWHPDEFPEQTHPKFLLPLVAWNLGEQEILDSVARSGLVNPRATNPLLTNNALIPVIGLAETARFGKSTFEDEFATMVREGKADREWWLAVFELLDVSSKTGWFIGEGAKETLKWLDVSPAELGIG